MKLRARETSVAVSVMTVEAILTELAFADIELLDSKWKLDDPESKVVDPEVALAFPSSRAR